MGKRRRNNLTSYPLTMAFQPLGAKHQKNFILGHLGCSAWIEVDGITEEDAERETNKLGLSCAKLSSSLAS